MEDFMLPCLNKQVFGIDCLGCGAQRSLFLVFQGHFEDAFFMFPAIYTLLLLASFLVINLFIKFKSDFSIKIGLILLNAAIILVSYLYKMQLFFT